MLLRLLLLIPIVFIPNTLRFDMPTGIPAINLTNLMLIVILAVMATERRDPYLPRSSGMLTAPLIALFAVLGLGFAFTQVFSPANMGEDILYVKNAVFYLLLYFVYRNCGQDAEYVRKLILLTMAVAALAGLEAIHQGLAYGIGNYSETNRASGPFALDASNANLAGVFFAMFLAMFVAVVLFLRGHWLWRLLAIGGSGILALGIMVTYSRQSYFIAVLCMGLLLMRRNLALAILLGALALPAIALLPASVTQRVQQTQQQGIGGGVVYETSAASRVEIWKGAAQMWAEYPWGVGLNRFKHHIGDYTPAWKGYDAHNSYVLTLAELGPVGLAVLLWFLWRLWRLSRKVEASVPRDDSLGLALAMGFTMAVLAFAMGNLYGSRIFSGTMTANFWILCALMERYAALTQATAKAGSTGMAVAGADESTVLGGRFPLAARILPGRYLRRK
ncbi:MAG TPA: O-antigen ligase family protein [Pseudoxanthomonas sp.]